MLDKQKLSMPQLMLAGAGLLVSGFLLLWPFFLKNSPSSGEFLPHIICYLKKPGLIWLHFISDLLIGLAYVGISVTLAYIVYQCRRQIPFCCMIFAFGLFIVACGMTHFMEVLTLWKPYYWLSGWIKVITALVSVTTAVALPPRIPDIFNLIQANKLSTERKRELEIINGQLNHLAKFDALTDLPNRTFFSDRLSQALTRAPWHNRSVAVLFIDLDGFKKINDTLGHPFGDLLLTAVAKRLTACVREGDSVARLGGDEFVIMLDDMAQPGDIVIITQKILQAFSSPFHLEGHEVFITASIGVAVYPNDGKDNETLLRNADTAMYSAKKQGRNNYQLYSLALNAGTPNQDKRFLAQ